MRLDSPSICSSARLAANKANAQHSTGPKTEEGRAAVSQNNWRHGLTGSFMLLPWEVKEDFVQLVRDLHGEHQPSTPTEQLLVDRMAQHHWLMQRAISLQALCFNFDRPGCDDQKELALYIRYQATHERAFHKCLRELMKLRAEARKLQSEKAKEEIGFESQKRAAAAEARKQAAEKRAEELHSARLQLLESRIDAQIIRLPQPKLAAKSETHLQSAA
jgi:hypothetical protein